MIFGYFLDFDMIDGRILSSKEFMCLILVFFVFLEILYVKIVLCYFLFSLFEFMLSSLVSQYKGGCEL